MIAVVQKIESSMQNIDDSTSLDSSCQSYKRLQRSSSRGSVRSTSKQSNTELFKNFYVKKICPEDILRRNARMQNQQGENKKKRDPTPCRSRKSISYNQSNANLVQQTKIKNVEHILAIEKLQQQLKAKDTEINKIYTQNKSQVEQIKQLKNKFTIQQKNTTELTTKLKQYENRILQLQETLYQSQANLTSAKNNLQKIKKSIQQNKVNDLKRQNQQFRKKLEDLTKQTKIMQVKIFQKDKLIQQMDSEIKVLRNKVDFQLSIKADARRQYYLQNQVRKLRQLIDKPYDIIQKQIHESIQLHNEQKLKLQSQLRKLNIKLDYIQRKHIEDIKIFAKSKSQQLSKYKSKYKKLQQQYEKKRKQWQQQIKFYTRNKITQGKSLGQVIKNNTIHRSLINCDQCKCGSRSRKLSTSFSLSPDQHQRN